MNYTFVNLAEDVLKAASEPLTYGEIWAEGVEKGLDKKVGSKGLTPWASLSAYLGTEVLHNGSKAKFIRVGSRPYRYFLRSRENEVGQLSVLNEKAIVESPPEKIPYLEKDLHPLIAYLAATNPDFFGETCIYTKTIAHQKTRGSRASRELREWLHPDMVGVYFPFGDLEENVIKLSQSLNSESIQVFSFELKRKINRGNYREYFFQAVSNSSWAHKGYLVAAEIAGDDELHRELRRLTNAFGIGIIDLNVKNIDSARVLFEATTKNQIDWDTVDKLCRVNKDFDAFIKRLNTDIGANQAHESEYDKIIEDPIKYIQEKLNIKIIE